MDDEMISERQGFTLIELVMVIIIIGILSVLAFAKYQDFNSKAQSSALANVASTLAAASAVNYAAKQTGNPYSTVKTCGDTALTLQNGVLPTGFSFPSSGSGNSSTPIPDGKSTPCAIQGPAPSTSTTTFNAIGTS